jgi:hypothetical protein
MVTDSRLDELRLVSELDVTPSPDVFLALPLETLSREKREEVMADQLLPFALKQLGPNDPAMVKSVTSAMIKVMEKPTFYKVCTQSFPGR